MAQINTINLIAVEPNYKRDGTKPLLRKHPVLRKLQTDNITLSTTPAKTIKSLTSVQPERDNRVLHDDRKNGFFARMRRSFKRLKNITQYKDKLELEPETQSVPTIRSTIKDHNTIIELNNKFSILADEESDTVVETELTKTDFGCMNREQIKEVVEQFHHYRQERQEEITQNNIAGLPTNPPRSMGVGLDYETPLLGPTNYTENHSTQTTTNEIACGTDEEELQNAKEEAYLADSDYVRTVVKSKRIALKQKVKAIRAYNKLYYFLKSKHLFAPRTTQLLITMRADARIWMLGNGFDLTTETELEMLGEAVLAAYKLHAIELKARYLIYKEEINNIAKHNEAMGGKYTPGMKAGGPPSWAASVRLPTVHETI